MKKIYSVSYFNMCLIALCFPFFATAATVYTTLSDGLWNDASTVWSLDGTNPCTCAPSPTVDDATVILQHVITMTANVRLVNGAALEVQTNGTLEGPGYRLRVDNGLFKIDGNGQLLRLALTSLDAQIQLNGTLDVFNGNVTNTGIAILNGGNLHLYDGIFSNASGGYMLIQSNPVIQLDNGDFMNAGRFNLNLSCLNLNDGRFINLPGGLVIGRGTIVANDDIENISFWNSMVNWCTTGNGTNLPNAENCAGGLYCAIIAPDLGPVISLQRIGRPAAAQAQGAESNNKAALEEMEKGERAAYPNPFSDLLRLDFSGPEGQDLRVELRDLNGKTVFVKQVRQTAGKQTLEIPSTDLAAGMYLLTVTGPDGARWAQKITHQ